MKSNTEHWTETAQEHVQICQDESCEWCQGLCDDGIIISCDSCGWPGHTDSMGWVGQVNEQGQCTVYCLMCAHKLGIE